MYANRHQLALQVRAAVLCGTLESTPPAAPKKRDNGRRYEVHRSVGGFVETSERFVTNGVESLGRTRAV